MSNCPRCPARSRSSRLHPLRSPVRVSADLAPSLPSIGARRWWVEEPGSSLRCRTRTLTSWRIEVQDCSSESDPVVARRIVPHVLLVSALNLRKRVITVSPLSDARIITHFSHTTDARRCSRHLSSCDALPRNPDRGLAYCSRSAARRRPHHPTVSARPSVPTLCRPTHRLRPG